MYNANLHRVKVWQIREDCRRKHNSRVEYGNFENHRPLDRTLARCFFLCNMETFKCKDGLCLRRAEFKVECCKDFSQSYFIRKGLFDMVVSCCNLDDVQCIDDLPYIARLIEDISLEREMYLIERISELESALGLVHNVDIDFP